jgi:RNA polymerase sigma factor (sigma-70 family)
MQARKRDHGSADGHLSPLVTRDMANIAERDQTSQMISLHHQGVAQATRKKGRRKRWEGKWHLMHADFTRNVSLKGWLFQVARNRCLDELHKRRRRPELSFSAIEREDGEEGLSSLEAIADREPLPEEMIESSELHGSLRAAMVSLPPQLCSIVHLRCFRQMTFAEIGRILNLQETTVKTYFYRSLPHLRRALTSNELYESTS